MEDKDKATIVCLLVLFGVFVGMTFGFIDNPLVANDEEEREGDGSSTYTPPVNEGGAAESYDWYQMTMWFEVEEEPFEPLMFIPAIGGGIGIEDIILNVQLWQIYNFDAPHEMVPLLLDGSTTYSNYDYPIETTDPRNGEYGMWASGEYYDDDIEFWFDTDYDDEDPSTDIWLIDGVLYYDGGFLIKVSYDIPVYSFDFMGEDGVLAGYVHVGWIHDGSGNRFNHEWMV